LLPAAEPFDPLSPPSSFKLFRMRVTLGSSGSRVAQADQIKMPIIAAATTAAIGLIFSRVTLTTVRAFQRYGMFAGDRSWVRRAKCV